MLIILIHKLRYEYIINKNGKDFIPSQKNVSYDHFYHKKKISY